MSVNKGYRHLLSWIVMLLFPLLFMLVESDASAQSSGNYKLCTSVFSEGGVGASSTNFKAITTIGQPSPVGEVTDRTHSGYYGFWQEILGQEVGIKDRTVAAASNLPKVFSLSQNHPNPFNPTTQLKYDLPKDCLVKLEVYNILGQKVATLVDREQKAGYKTVKWDANSLSSGIYFYRLQAEDFVQTRKMVLLK